MAFTCVELQYPLPLEASKTRLHGTSCSVDIHFLSSPSIHTHSYSKQIHFYGQKEMMAVEHTYRKWWQWNTLTSNLVGFCFLGAFPPVDLRERHGDGAKLKLRKRFVETTSSERIWHIHQNQGIWGASIALPVTSCFIHDRKHCLKFQWRLLCKKQVLPQL